MSVRMLAAATAVLCVGSIGPAHSQGKITLRYGEIANSARGVSAVAINIAQRKGFLQREGIDVGGSANQVYSLIAKPEIKSFDDLKGKMVGMSLAVDTISIASRLLLEKHGLKEGAYRTRELVGTPVRADCLSKGECDAVPLGQPDDILFVRKGYNKLGDSLEVIPVLQFSVIAARRDWAQANPEAATRLARAVGGAYKFMRDKANRDEVATLAAEMTGAPIEVMRAVLAFYYEPDRGVMPKQGEIDMAGVAKVIELLGRTGELKAPLPSAERFVDLQVGKVCSPHGAKRNAGTAVPHCASLHAGYEQVRANQARFTGVPMKSRLPSSMPQWRRMS